MRFSNTNRDKSAVAAAFLCGILLAAAGCGIPKLHPPLPGPEVPPTFNGSNDPENSAQVPIAEFFNDPLLISLVDQALWGNQELRILAQDIAIAQNEVWRRSGAYLPFLTFGANASYDKLSTFTPLGSDLSQITTPVGGPFPNPLPDFLLAGDITWQIDVWRQLRNARDAQSLRYLGTIDGRNYIVTRMVAEIAENYYRLMGLDKQLETLDGTIALMEQSLALAKAQKEGARGTELGVQRFLAEVRKNQSQKLIVRQEIIQTQNRINFLCGRYPQLVERISARFLELQLQALRVGVPSQLLLNRPDIREAERNLQAAGIDIRVARASFFPKVIITSGVGYEAFQPQFLFYTPESLIYSVAGGLVAPVVNRRAIQAEFLNANARQLQALYEYQRTVLNAFTEVVNRVSKVQNYSQSIELKFQQLASLESAVDVANKLFQNARIEYLDVLTALRDRNDARIVLIETKQEQLSAIVNAYQALGGGWRYVGGPIQLPPPGFQGPLPPPLAPPLAPPARPAEEIAPPQPGPVVGPAQGGPAMQAPGKNEPVIQGPVQGGPSPMPPPDGAKGPRRQGPMVQPLPPPSAVGRGASSPQNPRAG
ncbi:MAG TPA: TolC family protein [Pirellulales bacterium]|nr:TolC family protein [Pirellulales bacterium]